MEKRFKGINDMAKTPEDGLPKLKKLISNHLGKLPISKKYIPTIQNQVAQWLGIWELWQNRNDRVVEVWALFWLYRTDGHLQWTIKVIWDADVPSEEEGIKPHYGYEIYLNRDRVAGPGHVYFTQDPPRYYRDGEKMHEVEKGIYAVQVYDVPENPQFRLDCAMRLWGQGADVELNQAAGSREEYNQLLWASPDAWGRFGGSSFGCDF